MWKFTASLATVTTVLVTLACGGPGGDAVGPSPLSTTAPSTNVGIQPSIITAQPVNQPSCPTVQPFLGSLNVRIQSVDFPLSLNRVQMTFTDSARFTAPTVTLPAPVLTQQFGSTLIEARSSRNFPFTFPFGCGTRRTGTLLVVVVVVDREGRETSTEVRVPVQ